MSAPGTNTPSPTVQPTGHGVGSSPQGGVPAVAARHYVDSPVSSNNGPQTAPPSTFLLPPQHTAMSSPASPRKPDPEIIAVQSALTTTPPHSFAASVIDSSPCSPRSFRWYAGRTLDAPTSGSASFEVAQRSNVYSYAPISDRARYHVPWQSGLPTLDEEFRTVFRYEDLSNKERRDFLSLSGVAYPEQHTQRTQAQGSYLEHYPVPPPLDGHHFGGDPLLRSRLAPTDARSYMREQGHPGHPQKFYHNDLMLDNIMSPGKIGEICAGTVPTYVDVPNFGRMQGLFAKQADGTVYPLITLPKMTPHDIFKTIDKMQAQKRKSRRQHPFWTFVCCQRVEAEED
ncbi:conserved hypothetical protein [Neospora caninum Liverpool]|uniref:Uncharacterized protein n=1 Tax=Neospora caninum (strain Liverpool) TaxID=572307 RepID=F0VQ05_NEOCL|nr:conserved hypothetical protein [Neospora caninum Liverpool]CBZ55802.1 conserved hypothetical protein [Neospora caninum Liverpool]CEL70544.1 TPA: hypothetical protein BN1204_062280 [Neospora caninum Liverpool]|eukprot:XP_003885828.1 conserved hypothetical protein [Neospora caninum Liverpool]